MREIYEHRKDRPGGFGLIQEPTREPVRRLIAGPVVLSGARQLAALVHGEGTTTTTTPL